MVARKKRIRVVLDTNVLVAHFLTTNDASPNRRVCRLWLLEKRLQLIVNPAVIEEYLLAFAEVVGLNVGAIRRWRARFEHDSRCTVVRLGRRYTESRDPDDNIFLATARAGRAGYLVTNDRDLLDLPETFLRLLPFAIVRPQEFLEAIGAD